MLAADPATAQIEETLGLTSPAGEAEESGAPRTIEVDGTAPSDEAVSARLRSIFQALEGLDGIQVTVIAGIVTLSGQTSAPAAEEALHLADRVEGVVAVLDRMDRSAPLAETLRPGLERMERRLKDGVRLVPVLAVGLAIFGLFILLGSLAGRQERLFLRVAPNAFTASMIAHAVQLVLVLLGLVAALEFIGATALLGAILGAAGILGLAVGFAVRDTIENYIASVLLSIRQPFAPNDFVSIEGREGFVLRLTSRATILLSAEGNDIRIPNAAVFKSVIVNFTRRAERRFDFVLGVNADANLKDAVDIGEQALCALDFVLPDPKPAGWIESVGDSSVLITWTAWIDQDQTDFMQARSESIRLVKRALEETGFELPEPIYRLRFDPTQMPVQQTVHRPPSHEDSVAGAAGSAESPQVGDTSNRSEIEDKVSEDRREGQLDLLDPQAPKE